MGVSNYGLWKGTPTSWNGTADSDHGHLQFTDGTDDNKSYQADVNIMSSTKDTRLVYWLVSSFNPSKPSTSSLQALKKGFSTQSGSDSLALDFLREGFINIDSGTLLSHDPKNPTEKNDILTYLDPVMNEAVKSKATIYIWGSQYNDSDGTSGIHDIHMNQGNSGSFEDENGTYQDGGIVFEYSDGRWEGVFLAFATEATKTDSSGNPDGPTFATVLADTSSSTATAAAKSSHVTRGSVGIEAALVNPVGPDQAPTSGMGETVYVQNRSSKPHSLKGWTIENGQGQSQKLPDVDLSEHSKRAFVVFDVPLSNKGSSISLKDGQGEVVSEVSYTEKQARKEGRLLYFAN